MKRAWIFWISIVACHGLGGALPDHSVSPSRQFVIYGTNTIIRGAISELAEKTKGNLLNVLQQPDRWKTPIVINLQLPQANVPEQPRSELRFSQTGFGLKLQLDLIVANQPDPSLIERELLRAILLEMIYRRETNISPGSALVEPPDWLLDGVLALSPGRDRKALIEALEVSKIIPLGDFLRQRPALLDSPGRSLHRAYSFALIQLLTTGTERASRLARYIDNLSHATNDPLADLTAQFPFLRRDTKETWQSTVRRLRTTHDSSLLGFEETQQQLTRLLKIKLPNQREVELSDFLNHKLSTADKAILVQLSQQLLLLGARANPLLRPIVREYQQIADLMGAGKRRKLVQRLDRLKTTRAELASRMVEIDDYLNWFEATQPRAASDMFADYLKAAADSSGDRPSGSHRRRDALSVYLDSLETQF